MRRIVPVLLPLAVLAGCGTTMPSELVSARSAYQRAAQGPAAQHSPSDLHEAKTSLDRAEAEYKENGDSDDAKAYGYIAERKALHAESVGRAAQVDQQVITAEGERRTLLSQLTKNAEEKARLAAGEAKRADEAARAAKTDLDKEKTSSALQQKKLEAEKAAREAAEARAADALAKLGKEEARGLVITLSGSVLFTTGTSDLLPAARTRLDEVADALKSVEERTFVVEGHTDAVGSDDSNLSLSQRRADTVRAYLVSKGVDPARIRALGKGEHTPVATNATPEGRANNRRVEIVVQNNAIGGGPSSKSDTKSGNPYE